MNIKLKELCEKYGIKQSDVSIFSLTVISKLERRKDLKISTLLDYLESLGFGFEITALPKKKRNAKEVLLRVF